MRIQCRSRAILLAAVLVSVPVTAHPQTPPPDTSQPEPEERPTGLPRGIKWTFNLDATWGTFGFANSLYENPKEGVGENLSDQWFEGSIKPALSGTFTTASSSEFYGKVSGAGERTYGSAPLLIGFDVSSFQAEDLAIGWRSGKSLDIGENALDFTVGRAQYTLGHGLLLWDGAAEGGSRGGYWTNVRKAFEFAAIARFHPGAHTVDAFYLDKDDLPENETGTRVWGLNYELSVGENTTVGASYLGFFANPEISPGRDGLDVFNVRAYTAPIPSLSDLSFELEYASERNGEALHSDAWTAQGAYELSQVGWKPKFTYRYAAFRGDDPATTRNEAFDPLLPGFYDWGSWWQGEIAGEYFLANSNQNSNLLRVHVTPNEAVSGGLLFFKFALEQPASHAPGVTSRNLAGEVDAYVDWRLNKNFLTSFVFAFADPGLAVEQASGRTKNFSYGMVFVAYSY
jgi:hypothetical protein